MQSVETLLPVVLLIGLGHVLARCQFLGQTFIADLNKLTFYIALPVFIVRSIAEVRVPPGQALALFGLIVFCTLVTMAVAFALARLFRWQSPGSAAQAAFRGNAVYAGLPIITYALSGLEAPLREQWVGTTLLVFGPLAATYNFLGVLCLQNTRNGGYHWTKTTLAILRNPLIVSCILGFALSVTSVSIPTPLDRAMQTLGSVALPVALLCIGGTLGEFKLGGDTGAVAWVVGLKIIFLPTLAWLSCSWLEIDGPARLVVMVLAGAPTAATAYTMATQMRGDAALTSQVVALSTVISMGTLMLILWLCGVGS